MVDLLEMRLLDEEVNSFCSVAVVVELDLVIWCTVGCTVSVPWPDCVTEVDDVTVFSANCRLDDDFPLLMTILNEQTDQIIAKKSLKSPSYCIGTNIFVH